MLATSLVASIAVPANANAAGLATDLIISEYIEGSGLNKAIELYNGTGETIDLSHYTLELYSNGSTTAGNTQKLTGSLAHGETIIIYNSGADDSIKSKGGISSSSVTNFNGDDAIVLKNQKI